MVTNEERKEKIKGVWDKQLYVTMHKINNKDLLYSTGNHIQESEKNTCIHTHA